MFDVLGFDSSISNSATAQQVSALADLYQQPINNNIVVKRNRLFMAWAFGTNLTRAYLRSPSLLRQLLPEVRPFLNAVPGSAGFWSLLDFSLDPLTLDVNEQLSAYATQGAGGNQREYIFGLFIDAPPVAVSGKLVTPMRATATTTLVADTWTACPLTFDQNLGAGTWAVVGARCESAGALAFRMIFPQGVSRPGGPAYQNAVANDIDAMRFGGWGEWGRFTQNDVLQVEVLSTSADTAETVTLDLVKVA